MGRVRVNRKRNLTEIWKGEVQQEPGVGAGPGAAAHTEAVAPQLEGPGEWWALGLRWDIPGPVGRVTLLHRSSVSRLL